MGRLHEPPVPPRTTARKYGCGLADNRGAWFDYRRRPSTLSPTRSSRTACTCNDHGNSLMAMVLVKRYRHPSCRSGSTHPGATSAHAYEPFDLGKRRGEAAVRGQSGRPHRRGPVPDRDSASDRDSQVRIDGKRPSELPGAYAITRPAPHPWAQRSFSAASINELRPLLGLNVLDPDRQLGRGRFEARRTFSVAGAARAPTAKVPAIGRSSRNRAGSRSHPKAGSGASAWSLYPGATRFAGKSFPRSPTWSRRRSATVDDPPWEPVVTLVQGIPTARHLLELRVEGPDESSRSCADPVTPGTRRACPYGHS